MHIPAHHLLKLWNTYKYQKSSRQQRTSSVVCQRKTALEAAIGMSYAGKRAIVCMKHVGLNVAADAFMNVAITGTNGGLVILSADDPSMHSSQNEQDSRYYGQFAFIPVFEPSNQQEAYDMTVAAFDFSEKHNVAVLLRITTRLAHSRAGVKCHYKRDQNKLKFPDNPRRFILLPAISLKQYIALHEKQEAIRKDIESSTFCTYIDGEDKSMGIITSRLLLTTYKKTIKIRNVLILSLK